MFEGLKKIKRRVASRVGRKSTPRFSPDAAFLIAAIQTNKKQHSNYILYFFNDH